jgi:hypothetical protein
MIKGYVGIQLFCICERNFTVAVTQDVAQLRHYIVGENAKYPVGQVDKQVLLKK